jgi:hypothetical protein
VTDLIWKKAIAVIAVAAVALAPLHAIADESLCVAKGYEVLFFNGVWNMPDDASSGMEALRAIQGDTFNGQPVKYDVMYNHTGNSDGATALEDIFEVFEQRAAEMDPTGDLAQHVELIWETLSDGRNTYWQVIVNAIPQIADAYQSLVQDIDARYVAALARLVSNPPTEADYAAQDTRLDALRTEGQMLMFVAHSQGNLFANHAYDYIQPKIGSTSIGVVHVAPASPTLRGPYTLADIDLVINGLRIQGLSTVPAINLTLPFAAGDPSGHTLVGTYLDPARAGRNTVASLMTQTISALQPPAAVGSQGFFTLTLTWDGVGDIDLHTFEPGGSHVFYGNPQGLDGFLDVDNTVAFGPEHYYASCDPGVLQAGTYSIGINDYSGGAGRTATVQVSSSRDGVLLTTSLPVGPARGSSGDPSPTPVVEVIVTKDPVTNAFEVTTR